jgi:two-component system, NtrC family, nitrogen regulation sensor histidine kinase GlnL
MSKTNKALFTKTPQAQRVQVDIAPDLLAHMPYAILTVTRDLHISFANNVAEDTLGESIAYLRKRTLSDIFHPSEKLVALVNSVFEQNSPLKEYDFTLSGHRVGTRTVTLHLVPVGNNVLVCFDDASAAHTLSHSVLQRQHAQAQSNMAAILAHEVKNPLAGIRGAAQLLQKTATREDRELTTLICNEADRIKSVVEEMEFFSNPSELKTEAVNIHEVLRYVQTITEKGAGKQVKFIERFDPSIPPVLGHQNLLIQAFINLLKNSIEATDNNAIITLSTSYQSGTRLRIGNALAPRKLPIHVTVEDNGSGIPPELQKSVFDPFITTKKTGKGLGLAIVAKIIADHGGVIDLDTGTEQGTRLHILLPVA